MKKRVIVKVGTKVLTDDQGVLSVAALSRIVEQIVELKKQGWEVVLVSSGATGAGRNLLKTDKKLSKLSEKQFYAAIGQTHLINHYSKLFGEHDLHCAQILATKEDFRDRVHFLNMRSCVETLLHDNVVPIMNENDVVALDELTFTDNDELAGLIASMLNADNLVILSSVDGLIDLTTGVVISEIASDSAREFQALVTDDKSSVGRGGMATKFAIAKKLASQGIEVVIANGQGKTVLADVLGGKKIGTRFVPGKKATSAQRRIAHSDASVQGRVTVNEGAVTKLRESELATSLLLVGVTRVEGEFSKGNVIEVLSDKGEKLGYGVSQYSSDDARKQLGIKNIKPLIHYNYMFIE